VTVWRHSISWSKFKLALECPLALQKTIDGEPPDHERPNYYRSLGTLVQKVFEEYFNQGVNLVPGGNNPKVLQRVVDRVLESSFYKDLNVTYPSDHDEADLIEEIRYQVRNGFEIFNTMKIVKKDIKSEVKWSAVFRGFRMFAMMDFYMALPGGVGVYDGKGHKEKNADPDQVRYYALALTASGRKVVEAGLIYWRHGFVPVDVSLPALRVFIDEKVEVAKPIFDQLKAGVESLPATPSKSVCKYCAWRYSCLESAYRRPDVLDTSLKHVGFDAAKV